jgi:hypothetical protein
MTDSRKRKEITYAMKLIVKLKTKKQEKEIKPFLENHSIDYIKLEEETGIYQTRKTTKAKQTTKKEKLISEIKEAVGEMKLIRSGKRKARNAEDFLNEL